MADIDPRLKKVLRKVLKQVNPENDFEYMRYVSISERIASLEKTIQEYAPNPKMKERAPRFEQLTKERCKAIARLLWKENPKYTIAELSTHPAIYNTDITGGSNFAERTVFDWIAEEDTKPKNIKPGRPPKQEKAS